MPSTTSAVGALTLPLEAGDPNTAIADPVVAGIADYLRHWIRWDLNTKLANLAGTSSDAVPAANVFLWNPLQPAPTFARPRALADANDSPFPALYVWGGRSRMRRDTIVYDTEEREIGVLWLFDELTLPGALEDRYGLRNAVCKSIERAVSLRYHPTYSYQGGAAGVPIAVSLHLDGHGIQILSCEPGMLSPIPATVGRAQDADQPTLRAFPSVMAVLKVEERVEQMTATAADRGDAVFTPYLGPDPLDPLAADVRILPAD